MEAGWGSSLVSGWTEWILIHFQPLLFALGLTATPEIATTFQATMFMWTNTCWGGAGLMMANPGGGLLDAYKVGHELKIKTKDIFVLIFQHLP